MFCILIPGFCHTELAKLIILLVRINSPGPFHPDKYKNREHGAFKNFTSFIMQKYKIGLIGAGMIAEKHALGLQKTGRVEITRVARKNETLLKDFQNKYDIPHGSTNYQDLLNDPEIEAVVIASPPDQHSRMLLDALAAGKHVLLEKPMAISAEDVDQIVKAHRRHPELKVLECSCRHARLQPKYRFVKELIDSGILGEIYYIHHNSVAMQSRPGIEYHPSAKWFLDRSKSGGGPIMDWGVYDLSFHLGVMSDRPELTAVNPLFLRSHLDQKDPGTPIYDVEEHFAALLQFNSGLKFYWERAAHANMKATNETRIYGTKGGIKLSYCTWDSNIIEVFGVANDGKGNATTETYEIDVSSQDDDNELSKHFIDVLDGKAEPLMSLELAAKHLKILLKMQA
jgi:predicted dehydrogenase